MRAERPQPGDRERLKHAAVDRACVPLAGRSAAKRARERRGAGIRKPLSLRSRRHG